MPKVNVNDVRLVVARESGFGVANTADAGTILEPNEITNYGGSITTVARSPLGDRQSRKGTVTDFEAAVEIGSDLTRGDLELFAPGFMLQDDWDGFPVDFAATEATAGAAGGFTVGSDLKQHDDWPVVGSVRWGGVGALINVEGFTNAANNGLHVIDGAGIAANKINVNGSSTVAESGANARISVVGFRANAVGDIQWQNNKLRLGTLTDGNSASDPNWRALGVESGHWIFVGGDAAARKFDTESLNGWKKVRSVGGQNNRELTFEGTTGNNDPAANKTIEVYFGRRVHTQNSENQVEIYHRFEALYPGLGANRADEYEYVTGCAPNQWTITFPLTDKVTHTPQFVAKEALRISDTKGQGGGTPPLADQFSTGDPAALIGTEAYNTSLDIARVSIAGNMNNNVLLKSLEIIINNNYSAEKVLARQGAAFMNLGALEVTANATLVFTDKEVINSIYGNETQTIMAAAKNNDGTVLFEIPALTLGGGQREFTANETVRVSLEASAFKSDYGDSINIMSFRYLPDAADVVPTA